MWTPVFSLLLVFFKSVRCAEAQLVEWVVQWPKGQWVESRLRLSIRLSVTGQDSKTLNCSNTILACECVCERLTATEVRGALSTVKVKQSSVWVQSLRGEPPFQTNQGWTPRSKARLHHKPFEDASQAANISSQSGANMICIIFQQCRGPPTQLTARGGCGRRQCNVRGCLPSPGKQQMFFNSLSVSVVSTAELETALSPGSLQKKSF